MPDIPMESAEEIEEALFPKQEVFCGTVVFTVETADRTLEEAAQLIGKEMQEALQGIMPATIISNQLLPLTWPGGAVYNSSVGEVRYDRTDLIGVITYMKELGDGNKAG